MKTIHKYTLELTDFQTVGMPLGAKILAFQMQHGVPTIWAQVSTRNPLQARRLYIVGTGNPVSWPDNIAVQYVGTVQERQFVWHLFDGGCE